MLFNGVSSQDVKLALRWSLNAGDNFNSPLTVAPAYAPPAGLCAAGAGLFAAPAADAQRLRRPSQKRERRGFCPAFFSLGCYSAG